MRQDTKSGLDACGTTFLRLGTYGVRIVRKLMFRVKREFLDLWLIKSRYFPNIYSASFATYWLVLFQYRMQFYLSKFTYFSRSNLFELTIVRGLKIWLTKL